jgi:hypothetical protein
MAMDFGITGYAHAVLPSVRLRTHCLGQATDVSVIQAQCRPNSAVCSRVYASIGGSRRQPDPSPAAGIW